jgi:hypothetical protein
VCYCRYWVFLLPCSSNPLLWCGRLDVQVFIQRHDCYSTWVEGDSRICQYNELFTLIPPWYLKIRRQRKCVLSTSRKRLAGCRKYYRAPCSSIGCSVVVSSPVTSQHLTSDDRATQPLNSSQRLISLFPIFFFFFAFSPSNTPHNAPACFRAVHLLFVVPWQHPSRSRSSPVFLSLFSLSLFFYYSYTCLCTTHDLSRLGNKYSGPSRMSFYLRTIPTPP